MFQVPPIVKRRTGTARLKPPIAIAGDVECLSKVTATDYDVEWAPPGGNYRGRFDEGQTETSMAKSANFSDF
jgi:hypothetical protein